VAVNAIQPGPRPAAPAPAPHPAGRAALPADPPPGLGGLRRGAPGAGGGIFDLAVEPEEEERSQRQRGLEIERRLFEARPAAGASPRRERRPLGALLAAAPRAVGRFCVEFARGLPRPSDLPRWARIELLVGLLVALLVALAFWLDEGQRAAGAFVDEELGLTLTFPEEGGWIRLPVDVDEGAAAHFRSAAVPAESQTMLWVRRRPLRANSPYRPSGQRSSNQPSSPPPQPLDAAMMVLDASTLFAEALSATEPAFAVSETRGCGRTSIGAWRAARCRYLATVAEDRFELDLFAFGDERGLVLALLANRVPVTAETFAVGHDVVASIALEP
jgi:hypothetical protein